VLRERPANDTDFQMFPNESCGGKSGRLYLATVADLLDRLQAEDIAGRFPIPRNTSGLGRRLRTTPFSRVQFLDEKQAQEFPGLKRTTSRRRIGFFVEDDTPEA
jgi:hypothetical protein